MLPSPKDIQNEIAGQTGDWDGRLAWAINEAEVCLDRPDDGDAPQYPPGQFGDDFTALRDVTDGLDTYVDSGEVYQFEGWITDPIEAGYGKGYVADSPAYPYETKLRIELTGDHAEWIEAGQAIRFSAKVLWVEADGRIVLDVVSWILLDDGWVDYDGDGIPDDLEDNLDDEEE